MSSQILIIGSSNTDMVIKTSRLPQPGETIIGGTFLMNPGGKGANQAVAAARLGGRVTLVAKVGDDTFGKTATTDFKREGIDTQYVNVDPHLPSGVALINVDERGENSITVAPGANANLQPVDALAAVDAADPDTLLLLQLEIPLPTVVAVARRAFARGLRVVLNPAPAQPLPPELFKTLFLITPNETEAEQLTGIAVTNAASADTAAQHLVELGVANVIITMGPKGAYLYTDNSDGALVPGVPATAIDTTAAGDCFNGALTVALSEGKTLLDATRFATRAAAISVTRAGAQSSLPRRIELNPPAEPSPA